MYSQRAQTSFVRTSTVFDVLAKTSVPPASGGDGAAAVPVVNFVCPWLHTNACCDGCLATPISGCRYKCQVRKDFDLCSKCVRQESRDAQRHFIRIERCEASKPYQMRCIECYECASAPIKGPRYKHKTEADVDLCEGCFENATSSQNALESDFEKIEHTRTRSLRKKHHNSALHFEKACDECGASPIVGPCFTLVSNPNYDACAYCHDDLLMQKKFKEGDFVVASHPRRSAAIHLNIMSCVSCGVSPICGPAYQHQKKENKILCLLCYFQVKKEKRGYFTRVEPPHTISNFTQPPSPSVAPNTSLVLDHPAPHPAHLLRNKSDPVRRSSAPQEYVRSATLTPLSFSTGPPPASSYQYPTRPTSAAGPPPAASYQHPLPPTSTAGPPPAPSYQYPLQPTSAAGPPPAASYQYPTQPASAAGPPPVASYQNPIQPNYFGSHISRNGPAYPGPYPGHGPPPNTGNYGAATGARPSYRGSINSLDKRKGQMLVMYQYFKMQSAQRQQQILAFMKKHQHASHEAQSQFLEQYVQNLVNGSGNGAGGGAGVNYTSFPGGNNSSGLDYSSLVGGNTGGNNGGGLDSSYPLGAGGVDYSNLFGWNGGGGVDFSSLLGGNSGGGFDFSSLLSGGGGGVITSLIGAFSCLNFG